MSAQVSDSHKRQYGVVAMRFDQDDNTIGTAEACGIDDSDINALVEMLKCVAPCLIGVAAFLAAAAYLSRFLDNL